MIERKMGILSFKGGHMLKETVAKTISEARENMGTTQKEIADMALTNRHGRISRSMMHAHSMRFSLGICLPGISMTRCMMTCVGAG